MPVVQEKLKKTKNIVARTTHENIYLFVNIGVPAIVK